MSDVLKMNRAARRKHLHGVVNHVLKGREVALKKKQYGIGLVITTQMISIMFWRWAWVPWDRRAT